MANETIALFSSDARELYKADVYRALALPAGYVLQFRYPHQYVQSDILTNLASVINQDGVIFFVSGNDTSIPEAQRQLQFYSIRSVVIRDVVVDQHIDSIHFYLEMKDFIDAKVHDTTEKAIQPPTMFVSKVFIDLEANNKWGKRVDAVKNHFPDLPFFLVQTLRQGAKPLAPVYSVPNKSSSYNLEDESDYQVDIEFYDPSLSATGISVENGSPEVTLSIEAGHRIGAESKEPLRNNLSKWHGSCIISGYGQDIPH
jgi:hypothetical protein